jgi:hypothetical protein
MNNPFRYFNSSPEVIHLIVMMYVRFPLSLRNVEDLLAERGIDVSHETVRFWWNRFGPTFAGEIRKRRAAHMHGYPRWRWHLDEAFVKTQRQALLSLARRWSRRRGLGVGGHSEAGQSRGAEVCQARHEDIWAPAERRQRRALLLPRGDEKDRLRIVERSAVGLSTMRKLAHWRRIGVNLDAEGSIPPLDEVQMLAN